LWVVVVVLVVVEDEEEEVGGDDDNDMTVAVVAVVVVSTTCSWWWRTSRNINVDTDVPLSFDPTPPDVQPPPCLSPQAYASATTALTP
jgi:hypothetical protein